jgi:hypothetical protein
MNKINKHVNTTLPSWSFTSSLTQPAQQFNVQSVIRADITTPVRLWGKSAAHRMESTQPLTQCLYMFLPFNIPLPEHQMLNR